MGGYPLHGLRMDYASYISPSGAPAESVTSTQSPTGNNTPSAVTPTSATPGTTSPTSSDPSSNSASKVQIYPWMKKIHVSCKYELFSHIPCGLWMNKYLLELSLASMEGHNFG